MMIKVAVGSSDGIVVNAHFGRTPQFLIYEISENGHKLIEVRDNKPGCSSLNEPKGTMDETIEVIKDCQYLIVSQIGKPMCEKLKTFGIESFVIRNMIEEALTILRLELDLM